MKFKEIEINGQKFNVPAWTVGERRDALIELKSIADTTNTDPIKAYDDGIKFVAKNTGLTVEQVTALGSETYDKLYSAIATGNSGASPLPKQ